MGWNPLQESSEPATFPAGASSSATWYCRWFLLCCYVFFVRDKREAEGVEMNNNLGGCSPIQMPSFSICPLHDILVEKIKSVWWWLRSEQTGGRGKRCSKIYRVSLPWMDTVSRQHSKSSPLTSPGEGKKVKGESMESDSSTLCSARLQIVIQNLFTGFQPSLYTCIVHKNKLDLMDK